MSLRDRHVPPERLTVLALGLDEAGSRDDQAALAHAAECDTCHRELSRLASEFGALRLEAAREADAHFDEIALEMQRNRILDRLAHLGQSARVLPFPGTSRNRGAQPGVVNRRWISAAAAAGLLIGIFAGQLLHLVADNRGGQVAAPLAQQASARTGGPAVVPASAALAISDDDLLGEIDVAVQRRRAPELLALDALTPTASEIR
jgi:hypothetical protein